MTRTTSTQKFPTVLAVCRAIPRTRPAATAMPATAAPAAPATVSGKLDRAAAKRAWPAVLVEIKKLRPARASQYSDIEVDVDADGETLVLEFPADQSFSRDLAEQEEAREMLAQGERESPK